MFSHFSRTTLAVLAFGASGLLLAAPSVAADQAEPTPPTPPTPSGPSAAPVTVPALQEWRPGGRDFVLKRGAVQVQVDPRHAGQLADDARTFAEDLESLSGREVVVRVTPPRPGEGPGVLRMTLDRSLSGRGPETSRIAVDGDVTISGPTSAGVFSGTRSVLQMLRQGDRIPGGVADDWPGYAERSLMVDNGRKYFTPAWARREIRELSYLKYNQFRWHIADNAGFRIQSDSHPEVVSPEHWTKREVRDLLAYAKKYHIEVIPEIDMPGHMQYALRTHPELQIVDADGNRNANNLDPTDPAARTFAKEILDELVPLFPGRYFHTGGDEYTSDWTRYPVLTKWAQEKYGPDANSQDAVLDFTNFLDSIITSHGKTMRIWNDGGQGGAKVRANRNIVLEYWSSQHGGVLAQEFLDQGFRIVNANRDVLYDVPGATPTWNNLDPRKIFDTWDMTRYHDWIGPNTTQPHAKGVLGGQLHVWNDSPSAATEEQEAGRLDMPLRAMSQKLWESPLTGGWDALAARAFAVGKEPQWKLLDGSTQNLAQGALAWSSARERPDCHEAMLVDGDERTRWCGPKTGPQSVVIDLGRPVDLGTVALKWETAFASGFSVDASDDLRSWRTLHSTAAGDGGLDVLPVSGRGRYLRVAMTERGTQFGYSLREVQAYARGALVPAQFGASVDPAIVLQQPGATASSTLTVTNASAKATDVKWTASPPAGVTVKPESGTLRVPAGGQATAALSVSGVNEPGNATVPLSVTARSLGESVRLTGADLVVTVPYGKLSDAFNNVSVTTDENVNPPGLGDGFDGAGSSYSAGALAQAGVAPGTAFPVGKVTVRWPDVPVATANNLVANGQSITLNGTGDTIGVLSAASYGPATGDWTVWYSDGTSTKVRLSTPDWSSAPPPGSTVLAAMDYRNNAATGRTDRRTQLFYQRIPIDPGKTVTALTVPAVSKSAVRGAPALHVFDVSVG
ncbi:family 20 glycosylhydrolase [Actinomadura sp. 1N219]|uniref:family 20 glycosylhydrolase n=1 Tax=Actinomadura sp. 1N219 TaxID=3375152 RepID=UPI0037A1B0C1